MCFFLCVIHIGNLGVSVIFFFFLFNIKTSSPAQETRKCISYNDWKSFIFCYFYPKKCAKQIVFVWNIEFFVYGTTRIELLEAHRTENLLIFVCRNFNCGNKIHFTNKHLTETKFSFSFVSFFYIISGRKHPTQSAHTCIDFKTWSQFNLMWWQNGFLFAFIITRSCWIRIFWTIFNNYNKH